MKRYKENDTVILVDDAGEEFTATVSRLCASHTRRISDYEVNLNGQNLYFSVRTGKQKHAKKNSKIFTLK